MVSVLLFLSTKCHYQVLINILDKVKERALVIQQVIKVVLDLMKNTWTPLHHLQGKVEANLHLQGNEITKTQLVPLKQKQDLEITKCLLTSKVLVITETLIR